MKTTFKNIDSNKDMTQLFSGKGAQQKSFDHGDELGHKCFIVFQQPINEDVYTNTYCSFIDINNFLEYYRDYPDEEKRFYELIRKDTRCSEYYDFDFKMNDWDGETQQDKMNNVLTEFLKVRNDFSRENTINPTRYTKDDIVVLESCSLEKLSLHVIMRPNPPRFFSNTRDQKIFMTLFKTFLKSIDTKIELDMSVYASNSLMRLEGSHKKDQVNRKFKCITRNIFDHRLKFCSYTRDGDPLYVPQPEEKAKNIVLTTWNGSIPDGSAIKDFFDNLKVERWTTRETWRNLIWLAVDLKMSEFDIHRWSESADNYSYDATQQLIDTFDPDKCKFSVGTVLKYLKEDTDFKTYKKLTKEFIEGYFTNQNIEYMVSTSGAIEKPTQKWVEEEAINSDCKCVVIKAGLGKGKTTASVNHINNSNYKRIIVLTSRRSFAKSVSMRLTKETKHDFVIYSSLKGKDYIIKNPYVVIQVESLNRLHLDPSEGDTLLLLDEIESVLFQMMVTNTHSNKHIENLDMFEKLFKHASKIICLDAFISNRTLTTLKSLNIDYKYFNYTLPLEERVCVKVDDRNKLLHNLILDLGTGKKIFFFSSSNNRLVNFFLPVIREKFPDKKIIEYHSKFSTIDLSTINDTWKTADLVACTSTITVGCNFDLPDVFDLIYVYANASSKNLVRDIFQASYRVRHIKEKKMVYYVDHRHYGLNLPTNREEIKSDFGSKKHYIIDQYQKHTEMKYTKYATPKWISDLVLYNTFEQNMSIMSIEPLFQRYLLECNYEHTLDDEDIDDSLMDELADTDGNDIDIPYQDIKEITRSVVTQYRKEKMNSSLSKMQEAELEKFFFQHMLTDKNIWKRDVELDLWDVYKDFGKRKFRNIGWEKGHIEGTVRICDIVSEVYPEICSKLSLRIEIVSEICDRLNMKNTHDYETNISKTQLEDSVEWFSQNSKRIHTAFDIRNRGKCMMKMDIRKVTDLINKVFTKWGYSKIKKGTRKLVRVDGKRVDVTPYNILNEVKGDTVNVYTHIKPRKIKSRHNKVSLVREGDMPM